MHRSLNFGDFRNDSNSNLIPLSPETELCRLEVTSDQRKELLSDKCWLSAGRMGE